MNAIYRELDILLASFVLGICLALSYDLMRLGRRLWHRGWVWTGIEDVFFWLFSAFCFAVMCLWKNDGNFRWYMLAGGAAGAYLCILAEKIGKNIYKNVTKRLQKRRK